ncbi:S-adenosylmethionine decarboxylase family protein [Nocardiopsis sp. LOL_012]|uniref:S-adenosylmethionine decarboxylase family protein n=1 Tax=Nocardiopsis sp. LOL_012 TaxID=3345409 RepID=UPI003A897CE9
MICAAFDLLDCAHPDPTPDDLVAAMRASVDLLGVHALAELSVPFVPHGHTVVMVLAESHLTVSTWPEYRTVQVDLVTCRADTDPQKALRPVVELLGAGDVRVQRVQRVDPRQGNRNTSDRLTTPLTVPGSGCAPPWV